MKDLPLSLIELVIMSCPKVEEASYRLFPTSLQTLVLRNMRVEGEGNHIVM